jgi:hypothetical protein
VLLAAMGVDPGGLIGSLAAASPASYMKK